MKIDVITFRDKISDSRLSGSTAIVIDVLRCTSSMITALMNGADKLVPAVEPGDAAMLAANIGSGECVLGGERGGLILPGFDAGNSPAEYSAQLVKGRTVIISTTNGTNAICGAKNAKRVFLGAMLNCKAVAERALAENDDVLIICAGTDGHISADDLYAAGAIIDRLEALNECGRSDADADHPCVTLELSDIAQIAQFLYRAAKRGEFDLSKTRHYSRLHKLGFDDDIAYCLSEDITDIVPCYADGIITA